jgi:hypothetical protein
LHSRIALPRRLARHCRGTQSVPAPTCGPQAINGTLQTETPRTIHRRTVLPALRLLSPSQREAPLMGRVSRPASCPRFLRGTWSRAASTPTACAVVTRSRCLGHGIASCSRSCLMWRHLTYHLNCINFLFSAKHFSRSVRGGNARRTRPTSPLPLAALFLPQTVLKQISFSDQLISTAHCKKKIKK